MIRRATAHDMPDLLRMSRHYYSTSGMVGADWDDDAMAESLLSLMDSPDAAVMVAEDIGIRGMVVGFASKLCFSRRERAAQELGWFAEPGFGRPLLDALEDWARSVGCRVLIMVCMDAMRQETVGALYRRAGYAPLEHSYVKEL